MSRTPRTPVGRDGNSEGIEQYADCMVVRNNHTICIDTVLQLVPKRFMIRTLMFAGIGSS